MDLISLAAAKAHLGELVAQAGTGTAVRITRRGGPADLETPRALTAAMPRQTQSAQALAREMRDGDRY